MKKIPEKKMLAELKFHLVKNIDDYLPFPKPFIGKGPIKAVVVGADPSTTDRKRFDTVFDLSGNDRRYFKDIERNLNAIGLSIDNVYVQNYCQNYFTHTTYKQRKNWKRAAGVWHTFLITEVEDLFDPHIPILTTSEIIFNRLIYSDAKAPKEYYGNPEILPENASFCHPDRGVFPFYRHWRYNLERPEWENYKKMLTEYLKG